MVALINCNRVFAPMLPGGCEDPLLFKEYGMLYLMTALKTAQQYSHTP